MRMAPFDISDNDLMNNSARQYRFGSLAIRAAIGLDEVAMNEFGGENSAANRRRLATGAMHLAIREESVKPSDPEASTRRKKA